MRGAACVAWVFRETVNDPGFLSGAPTKLGVEIPGLEVPGSGTTLTW